MPPTSPRSEANVEFWYDVACPYAYLASTRIEALARDVGADLVWRPVLLGGLLRAAGSPMNIAASRPEPRRRIELVDLFRMAERLGVPLVHNPRHPQRTVTAMRLLIGCHPSVRPVFSHALYRAYWVDGAEFTDDLVGGIARDHGVDPAIADDPVVKQGLFDATAEASARGAFGVPTFTVGDELFWGVDRLHQVRHALGGARIEPPPATGGGHVVFFHDFASPFSYLASTQIDRVAAGSTLTWTPFLLGGLFREIGTPMIPIDAMPAAKRAWSLRDMARQADWWGVPFRYNTHFPLRTVTALRVALVDQRATHPLYRAAWVEDRDLSDDDVVRGVLDDAGLDGAALIALASHDDTKDRLRANTAWAQRIGACGAPTFLVGDDLVFWGEDRLDHVADALAGWRPAVG